ncbi:MAG: carbohydrate kinase family protein [Candidatus Shapirobacteria bacterium]
MFDVISIGAATVDIFAKSHQFLVKNNLLSLDYSSKSEISQSLICSGGGATNSSVCFSRLGLKSSCVSLIGDDKLKNFIIDDLKTDHVPTDFLTLSKNDSTDFSIILVAPDGGRSILTNRGQSRLEEKNIPWNKISKTKWLYITSLEGNIDLLEKLIGFALENNIKIALNPGNRELNQQKLIFPLLKYVDFLLLNKTESEILIENTKNKTELFQKLTSTGAKIIAVTNGREGAYVFFGDKQYHSPIINTQSEDETGAGDSFGSAFVAALIYQKDVQQSLSWGIKNSASVVSFLGAKPGLLNLLEISH